MAKQTQDKHIGNLCQGSYHRNFDLSIRDIYSVRSKPIVQYSNVYTVGIIKVKGFWPKINTQKPAWYLLPDGLVALVWHSQAQTEMSSDES